jgi:hypothetical protein
LIAANVKWPFRGIKIMLKKIGLFIKGKVCLLIELKGNGIGGVTALIGKR